MGGHADSTMITSHIRNLYNRTILNYPRLTCLCMALILGFFISQARYFTLDASADSLLLDDDQDLRLARQTQARYDTREFLFVTFTPKADLFAPATLAGIKHLRDELRALPAVDSVVSLVDVPLLAQAEGSLAEVAANVRTLEDAAIDIDKAREELLASPVYRELIISVDGKTTALQVNLKPDVEFERLVRERNRLIQKAGQAPLPGPEAAALEQVRLAYAARKKELGQANRANIRAIRAILQDYQPYGTLHLGGVPMVADDMITFIKNDLIVFGIGVFVFLIGMLSFIFRRPRWVILPLASCVYAGLIMIGLLGFIGWEVTVISSNFISLMLIITMSMNVHLIVRYRQLSRDRPHESQRQLVLETAGRMVWPCLYTSLTTIMAFGSLVVSGIKPVINFGWMMTIGLAVTFLTSFILFPALLALTPRRAEKAGATTGFQFTPRLAALTEKHGNPILLGAALLLLISAFGISRLEVENSFISYFSADTEIYRGLSLIDQKLGGTTPLDVLLKFEDAPAEGPALADDPDDLEALFDGFEAFEEEQDEVWFTPERINTIKRVHDYLAGLPEVGKVLSLASVIRVGEAINQGEFDAFELAIVSKRLPAELEDSMIKPYVSEEHNEARVNLRILDSLPDLRRAELLARIETDLVEKLQIGPDQFRLSGLLVLYNNMLQSLFRSQILTLGVVMAGIALMLFILFRSVALAVIGIIPNLLAAASILGLMGLLKIPLDMMTITIAAITIGIAVDNSIHYLYRFREEFPRIGDYARAMHYCHANIGKAVFYTASTIMIGFSILMLSNFIPTIYFGLLTALAMLIALLAALTLLPKLILVWRPFK